MGLCDVRLFLRVLAARAKEPHVSGVAYIRVDIAKIRARRPEALALWMGRYTLAQLSVGPQVGAETNLPHILDMDTGEAVVRISATYEAEFRALFHHGVVEAPANTEAWLEANRAAAHAITIPEGHGMRQIYEHHAEAMLAIARAA
jgi:hypothetical protein